MKYYHRHLPYYHPTEAIYFITLRLTESLPADVVENLKNEYKMLAEIPDEGAMERSIVLEKYFLKFDQLLDDHASGNAFLQDERVAGVIQEALTYRDGKNIEMYAYCIMPTHVHVVFKMMQNTTSLIGMLHSLKGRTAFVANQILGRTGPFWQHESYDHVVRDEEERIRIMMYVWENPVKAGLVQNPEDWKWSYIKI